MNTPFDIETRRDDFPVYIDYHKEDATETDNGSEDSGDLTVEQLRCALEKANNRIDAEKEARSDLQQQCINLAGKLGTAISNRDRAMKDLEVAQNEHKLTKALLQKKSSELSRYKELFYTKCEEISKAKEECAKLANDYHQAQLELEDLRKSLMMHQREKQDYEDFEYENQELLKECNMLKENLDHAFHVRNELEQELEEMKDAKGRRYADLDDDFHDRYDDIVAERNQLEATLEELHHELNEIKESSVSMQTQCTDLVSQLVKAINERDSARNALAEAEFSRSSYGKGNVDLSRSKLLQDLEKAKNDAWKNRKSYERVLLEKEKLLEQFNNDKNALFKHFSLACNNNNFV